MDQKGFLISMDAILGLLIFMVLMGVVTNVNIFTSHSYSQEKGFTYSAQESMELMANHNDSGKGSILAQIANKLGAGEEKSAEKIAEEFLNNSGYENYKFCVINQPNKSTITSKGDIDGSKNVNSAIRRYGDYTFQLYVGK
ncbi:hypothetical protein [Methanobacterium alcaliphilum]|uniref:hypothetical protein n=1 Tax=Methanobacterium alcaliphilum TaxID=392018 RepID=UPI00200AA875|nr:hypothetical protein [Methanobacterium alcaliphilum]MCK9152313.1 hypothetical protein [Methanobacterium alcaliphilum]